MTPENTKTLLDIIFIVCFFAGMVTLMVLGNKHQRDLDLKKAISPKEYAEYQKQISEKNNEKLKHFLLYCIIIVTTITLIGLLSKIFGFSIKDIIEIFK